MPPAPSLMRSRTLLVAGASAPGASLRLVAQTPLRRTLPAVRQLSASAARRAEPPETGRASSGAGSDAREAGRSDPKSGASDLASSTSSSTSSSSNASSSSSGSGRQTPGKSPMQRSAELRAAALRASLQARLDELRPRVMNSLQTLLGRWNEVSGYEEVEKLKRGVEQAEQRLAALRATQQAAQASHRATVSQRSTTQRTLNDLLSRKATWTSADLSSYTTLLQAEHAESGSEREAAAAAEQAERELERAWDDVVRRTLERYHEEWRWSERGRTAGTYISAGVVGLNVLLFITAILLVEPYKRRKLAETFEKRLLQGEAASQAVLQEVLERFEQRMTGIEGSIRGVEAGVEGLCARAGVRDALVAEAPVEPIEQAGTPLDELLDEAARNRERRERQTHLAMAGSVGFALGAGLLAMVSAAWSG